MKLEARAGTSCPKFSVALYIYPYVARAAIRQNIWQAQPALVTVLFLYQDCTGGTSELNLGIPHCLGIHSTLQ